MVEETRWVDEVKGVKGRKKAHRGRRLDGCLILWRFLGFVEEQIQPDIGFFNIGGSIRHRVVFQLGRGADRPVNLKRFVLFQCKKGKNTSSGRVENSCRRRLTAVFFSVGLLDEAEDSGRSNTSGTEELPG